MKPNPNPNNTQKTNTVQNDNKCKNLRGQCMNPNTCKSRNGTVINNLCPGGSDNKCSILKNSQTSSIKGVGLSCSDRGVLGTCVNINNTKCNAILANGKCSGPSNVKCCLRKKVPPTNSTTKPTTNDNKCISKGGQCMNPNKCKSNNGHVLNNLCPCGSDNKCCVPNNNSTKNNIFTKNNTSTKNNKSTKNNTSTSSTKIEKETSDLCPDKKIVIDISQWQDIQDYDTLAKLYDGVIIRVGDFQGDSDPDVIDEKWKTFYDNLKEKTKIGFYFFTRARTPDRIKKHVQMVYNKIIELENDFPLYIDMENNGGDNKTYVNDEIYNKPSGFHYGRKEMTIPKLHSQVLKKFKDWV